MLDELVCTLVRIILFVLNLLPVSVRVGFVATLIRIFVFFQPSYRTIAHRNLQLAFPEKQKLWRDQVVKNSSYSLARVLVDFARMAHLDADWVKNHVEFPGGNAYIEAKAERAEEPAILVGGHIGSFELLPFIYAICGCPMGYVVRNFKSKKLDQWWNQIREKSGNRVINRKGAFKGILKHLKEGKDIGLLIDQNIKKEHAVFVKLFGRPAATTRALGIAALRYKLPVYVTCMTYQGGDKYRITCVECDLSKIYANNQLSKDEKIVFITQLVTEEYEKMIKNNPNQWFWFHRRFRTTPLGMDETFYLQQKSHA